MLIPGNNSTVWRNYLGPNTHSNFRERAGKAISGLLRDIKEGSSCNQIIERWLSQLDKYDWRYYFVKYPIIICKSQYGKYWFPGDTKGCHFYTMHTALSTGGRHWEGILLALSETKGWSLGDYGNGLTLEGTDIFVVNERHSAIVRQVQEKDKHQDIEIVEIDHAGASDLIERIEYLRTILDKYRNSK